MTHLMDCCSGDQVWAVRLVWVLAVRENDQPCTMLLSGLRMSSSYPCKLFLLLFLLYLLLAHLELLLASSCGSSGGYLQNLMQKTVETMSGYIMIDNIPS
jgi:hypothetical protein